MVVLSWTIERWKEIFELVGTPFALFYTALALHRDTKARRADTLIEITKQHREIWSDFRKQPELAGLLDRSREMCARPLNDEELFFTNTVFLHFRASYGAMKAGIHVLPEQLEADWRDIFSRPAMLAAWDALKQFHDRKFVTLVERYRPISSPTDSEYLPSQEQASHAES